MKHSSLNPQELRELQTIVQDMTQTTIKFVDIRAEYAAKGVPPGQLIRLVNSMIETGSIEVDQELKNMVGTAESKFGRGTVIFDEFQVAFSKMVELQHDLVNFRRLVTAFNVNPFVVNKLVELQSQSPLDNGQGLLRELYKLSGYNPQPIESEGIERTEEEQPVGCFGNILQRLDVSNDRKKLIIDVLLGIGLGVGGIHLLT